MNNVMFHGQDAAFASTRADAGGDSHAGIQGPIHLYLWEKRTLFLGYLPESPDFVAAGACLIVGLEGPLEIRVKNLEAPVMTRFALVVPGLRLQYTAHNKPIACCFLDPLLRDYRRLCASLRMPVRGFHLGESAQGEHLAAELSFIYEHKLPSQMAYARLMGCLGAETDRLSDSEQLIQGVIDEVKRTATDNYSVAHYAGLLGLTEAGLSRKFREQTGVTLRRYLNWHRLFLAAVSIQTGKKLTCAAMDAGFTDAAHFTHIFREFVGVRPSFIQRALEATRFFP